jgi:thiosulfate dehydrogenase
MAMLRRREMSPAMRLETLMRPLSAPIAATLVLMSCVISAQAETPGERVYAQGVEGRVPSCASCHGTRGEGIDLMPRLAGLPAAYFADQMRAYAKGSRPSPVMQAIAKLVDTDQVAAVADYLADASPPYLPPRSSAAAQMASGAQIVALGKWSAGIPACRDCHGPSLRGGGPALPGLAGQPRDYLLSQLKLFRNGSRPGGPSGLMGRIAAQLSVGELEAVATYASTLREDQDVEAPRGDRGGWKPRAQDPDHFAPPPESALPDNKQDASAILLGERIFDNTPRYAPQYAGNTLSCRNCHMDRGRRAVSAPLWAAAPQYPMYRSKNRTMNSLAMRIADCFRYSQNGSSPPAESPELLALMTYTNWLATGLPIGITPKASGYPPLAAPQMSPDRQRGKAVYTAHCTVCHAENGQGSDFAGAHVIPALWGPHSYNWGAGMHTVANAASFIYANMPPGGAGLLTRQQAWDVAAWVDSQPRPQDPRFSESVEKTRELHHKGHADEYYGTMVDGVLLGAQPTP